MSKAVVIDRTPKIDTAELHRRIDAKHPEGAGEWIVCHEVANSTGGGAVRRADAIAMNLWPSRMALHGFEVKVSRSDWLRELKSPAKAEVIWRFCDYWWVVVSDKEIVKDNELPPGWGLMVPHGAGLKIATKADRVPAETPSFAFMASMLRAGLGHRVRQSEVQPDIDAAYERGRKSAESSKDFEGRSAIRELERLKGVLAEFQAATGVEITRYSDGNEIGEAFAVARSLTYPFGRNRNQSLCGAMNATARDLRSMVESANRALKALDETKAEIESMKVEGKVSP